MTTPQALLCIGIGLAILGYCLLRTAARGDRMADELAGIKQGQGRDEFGPDYEGEPDYNVDHFPMAQPPGVQAPSATSGTPEPEEGRRASGLN